MPREFYQSPNFNPAEPHKLAAIHVHTNRADGKQSHRTLLEIAVRLGIDVVVFTDHDRVESSIMARDYAKKKDYPIQVVTGSEVTVDYDNNNAHLLAIGIEKDIPFRTPLKTAISLIHKQGGLAIAPHPYLRGIPGGGSLGERGMQSIISSFYPEDGLDAIEVLNGAAISRGKPEANDQALAFYKKYLDKIGAVGGSDTHNTEMSSILTPFQGGDFFAAIKQGKTAVFVQDRQERLNSLNIAIEIAGDKVFQNIPKSIQRKMDRHIPSIRVFAAQLNRVSETDAGQNLSLQELMRFRNMKEYRKTAWLASRLALKAAYCTFNEYDLEIMNTLSIGNKIFGNHRNGPPYIENGEDLYYSLAHAGNMGVGAVADIPIGVDVERVNRDRSPRRGLLSDEEIVEESALNPDLDLFEICQKLASIKEAVGKGLLVGNSRDSLIRLRSNNSGLYTVEPFRNGVVLPAWQVRVYRKGDYFLTAAIRTVADTNLELNWIESSDLG